MDTAIPHEIDVTTLPELDTEVGMMGSMQQAEVGGHACLEMGILIATSVS